MIILEHNGDGKVFLKLKSNKRITLFFEKNPLMGYEPIKLNITNLLKLFYLSIKTRI